jgi:two-component system, cell cycle response regulator CtrA
MSVRRDARLGNGRDRVLSPDLQIVDVPSSPPNPDPYPLVALNRSASQELRGYILSGLPGIEDKVRGLGFGADDYMTKPFHRNELVARIHAIVRRSKGHAQSVIQTGDLVVSLDTKTVDLSSLKCAGQRRPPR